MVIMDLKERARKLKTDIPAVSLRMIWFIRRFSFFENFFRLI